MNKFFTVDIKPTITASKQHDGAFADGDLLFDWTAFNVPSGVNKLVSAACLYRGTDGAAQTFAVNMYFAKTISNTAPSSLGDLNATANGIGYYNNIIGGFQMEEAELLAGMDTMIMGMAQNNRVSTGQLIMLEGESGSSSIAGHDKLYIGGIMLDGDANFSTGVVTSRGVDVSGLSAATLVNADIEGTDPRNCFAVGDIIHAEDGVILGEIESMADANTIVFKTDGTTQYHGNGETLFTNAADLAAWKIQNGAGAAGDLASGDELYNLHPITIRLGFEQSL
tara:strand:+ start:60 stop:902 length:843 start_codon:yes stop_codon:yes gene_type:complete